MLVPDSVIAGACIAGVPYRGLIPWLEPLPRRLIIYGLLVLYHSCHVIIKSGHVDNVVL